ncbi:hypothetical protein [Halopseudomonas sabulinigri]|uniref:HEAT repeat domain-containing protein n=1 Tax=Halopseudomonas sabulinigri TaxID=472181 RepID=A0A1H1M362_9GAMM|nr:hypothetical protein [Halopseudomonas sabulinigri]SDR81264.1 hypothetical protein SAMN05216271_0468 [Halopseudomonas sabulinigri]
MNSFKRLVCVTALMMPLVGQAQQAPEVSDNVADIVADASMAPDVRIKRSMALLQERSRVLREQGDSVAADQLQRCITYLLQAPPEAEAAELAAQSAEAAAAGDNEAALVFAESAATLAGALSAPHEEPVLE